MTNSTHPIPEWLDDWEGCYTVDDGHPGSYAHEAVATTDSATVTLTCQCGGWSESVPVGDDEPTGLFDAWKAHVHAARAEAGPVDAIRAGAPVDGSTVTALCDEVEQLRAEAERLQGERDRLAAALAEADEVERLRTASLADQVEQLRAERDRLGEENAALADEVEQLHARIEGNLHALADAFIEEGVRLASVDQLDAELSERLERLASKAKANFGGEVAA